MDTLLDEKNTGEGEELLLSLIYPTKKEDLSEAEKALFEKAVTAQESFEAENGSAAGVVSRSVGDIKVTYDRSAVVSGGLRVHGREISPAAASILFNAGILSAWI